MMNFEVKGLRYSIFSVIFLSLLRIINKHPIGTEQQPAAIHRHYRKGLSDHIRHIVMINSINYDTPVTEMQQRLSQLQASFVKNVRIMFLQFPFWSTWYLHVTLFGTAGWWGWLLQLVLTGSFVYISYWVYKNLSMENRNKKWFRSLVEGSGAQSVAKAMAFYEEVEAFKGLKG